MADTFRITPYGDKPYHAGTAIPVFALRSKNDAGIGSFSDLKLFADFLAGSAQDIMQLLPINDTTTFMDWRDSYPYRATSVFALHPIYLDLTPFLSALTAAEKKKYQTEAAALNALSEVDYEKVLALKWHYARQVYDKIGKTVSVDTAFKAYLAENGFWLTPYLIFSYLRDKMGTSDFSTWKFPRFDATVYTALKKSEGAALDDYISFGQFMQYELHAQLSDAVAYAHTKGIAIKGDIAIGIAHDSADAWSNPDLYNMDMSAGAPPDVFSESGQNWGFPTYNWDVMARDGYDWWKKRMVAMSRYFDAYRLDHILGFFRIWEIPQTSVRGLLGQFSPALGLSAEEIENYYGIPLRSWGEARFTEPFIKDWVVDEIFGRDARDRIIRDYLEYTFDGNYKLAADFSDELKIVKNAKEADQNGLFKLYENVIFVKDHRQAGLYHPRIKFYDTSSYREFGDEFKKKLYTLYEVYFYKRNNDFWQQRALEKLPALTEVTDMLACGEDLGMVPDNVPDTMWQLKILRLILERMPADDAFVNNLDYAPYLSVVTTSSHDTSTLRQFWQEDFAFTQRYWNDVMGWEGAAIGEATPEIIQNIVSRALNSPAMLVILPLQDWLAMTMDYRREDYENERINQPDIPFHYWKYRMHLNLEDLVENHGLQQFFTSFIGNTRRAAIK
ncbi:MAG: 4-alpha-glucanotransferase [Streptococcaceae bacterium]|jgi:4-alpha-glucanotransferase|nr:4-alpha-glucanotransferase [Streptococcaceae bacterium]